MKKIRRAVLVASLFVLLIGSVLPTAPVRVRAAGAPVAQVSLVGQDGYVGTIFGWLDQSYSTSSVPLTTRILNFKGSQNWKGYDRYGNLITGSAGQVMSFQLDDAPVQLLTAGTYSYQIVVRDANGAQAASAW